MNIVVNIYGMDFALLFFGFGYASIACLTFHLAGVRSSSRYSFLEI